jgi:hypothetical protein
MAHGVVSADRGSQRVLDLDEAIDYMLLHRAPDPQPAGLQPSEGGIGNIAAAVLVD